MIKIENTAVFGWEAAIRGMRNPKNSWDKSDTIFDGDKWCMGFNDLALMKTLANAGTDHGKFLRMIHVQCDITAPDYWFKEFATYRVGVTENSTSTMHKIHAKEFTLDDFSWEHLLNCGCTLFEREYDKGLFVSEIQPIGFMHQYIIPALNTLREKYLETKDKAYWWQMIQLLPMSYNYRRTVDLNYAVLRNMYHARKAHKLDCWIDFCKWVESLPYSELITGKANDA